MEQNPSIIFSIVIQLNIWLRKIKFIKAVCKKKNFFTKFNKNSEIISVNICQIAQETFYEEIFSIEPSSRLTFFRGEVIVKNYNAIYDFSFKKIN